MIEARRRLHRLAHAGRRRAASRSPTELGSTTRRRRNVEFGALLHDVGKIAIPNEIINKPGPLDDREWAMMQDPHVEGQRMLERVGGLLGEVGAVVRASHERYDGGGYPDGLAGEAIPLASRIVSACDAFNAMTTDRSYRDRAADRGGDRASCERTPARSSTRASSASSSARSATATASRPDLPATANAPAAEATGALGSGSCASA